MLKDLAALTPPLLVCAAFLIALVAFLRHEMAAKQRRGAKDVSGDISGDGRIGGSALGDASARGEGQEGRDQFDDD